MPVGVAGRDVRAPGARGDRLRRRRPRGRAGGPGRRGPGPARGGHRRPGARSPPGCAAVLETPLGPVLGGLRLRDVAAPDRLDELEFELPLAGGDQPAGVLTLTRIADVLRDRLGPDDPLAGYADRLDDPRLRQTVRGYLTGSLDLVGSRPSPGGAGPGREFAGARLQDQLARRARRAADRRAALPPGGAGRRDAAPPLRAAGAAVLGRAAPLPALAGPATTTPTATWPGSSTCSCAG